MRSTVGLACVSRAYVAVPRRVFACVLGEEHKNQRKKGGGRVCYGRQLQNRVITGVEYAEEKKEQGNSTGFMKVRHKTTSKTDTRACFEEGRKQILGSKM